jgi:hypothetical protein
MAISLTLQPSGKIYGNLVSFWYMPSRSGVLHPDKIWQPLRVHGLKA